MRVSITFLLNILLILSLNYIKISFSVSLVRFLKGNASIPPFKVTSVINDIKFLRLMIADLMEAFISPYLFTSSFK